MTSLLVTIESGLRLLGMRNGYIRKNSKIVECLVLTIIIVISKRSSSPIAGLEWPRGFQEVKIPRLQGNGTGRW